MSKPLSDASNPAVFVSSEGIFAFPNLTSDELVALARVDSEPQPKLTLWFLEFFRRPRNDEQTLEWYHNYLDYRRLLEGFIDRQKQNDKPSIDKPSIFGSPSDHLRECYSPDELEGFKRPTLIEHREFALCVLETFKERFARIASTPSPRPCWKEIVLPEYVGCLEYQLTKHKYLYDLEDDTEASAQCEPIEASHE